MRLFYSLFFIVNLFCIHHLHAQEQITVVIDPGHGGNDPGHLAHESQLLSEKEINLKISLYLGGYIEKYMQNVKVIYTRTTDIYPSLDERVAKANKNNADYFISIHCNGNEKRTVHGTETHVHSMHLKQSVSFAKEIENQFSRRAGRKSRGVKDLKDLKHTLQVLKYTTMTSVLIECGFMTHQKEAVYLNSTYGQEIIASAIFRGLRSSLEKTYPKTKFRKTSRSQTKTTEKIHYKIQIMSSISPIETNSPSFKQLKMEVTRSQLNTKNKYKYIYTVGSYSSKKDALNDLKKIIQRGYKDAFITK